MKDVHHANIIRLQDSVETSEYFIIVMELMKGGDLFDRLQQQQTFLEEDARGLLIQVASMMSAFSPFLPFLSLPFGLNLVYIFSSFFQLLSSTCTRTELPTAI